MFFSTSTTTSSGCDINSTRQVGLKGEKPDICKTQETPLHLGTQRKRVS